MTRPAPEPARPILRVAVISADGTWREDVSSRLSPVEDLRVAVVGAPSAEGMDEVLAGRRVDVVVVDGAGTPSPSWSTLLRWREEAAGARPPVVAVVEALDPAAYRALHAAGVHEVVLRSAPLPELTEAVYRAARAFAAHTARSVDTLRLGEVVTLFSLRGGVGKTTLAANLAIALRQFLGAPVALLDLAFATGSVGLSLGLTGNRPLGELITEAASSLDAEALRTFLTPHPRTGVEVLCAPENPEVAEYLGAPHAEAILAAARQAFAFTVVDTSAALTEVDFVAAREADAVALVLQPDVPSVAAAQLAVQLLERFQVPRAKVGLVLNRWGGGLAARDVERTLGLPVWCQVAEERIPALRAMNEGVPLWLSSPRGPVSRACRDLARRLAGGSAARSGARRKTP